MRHRLARLSAHQLEGGGTLPASLWVLAVGALLMAPFLAFLSTSLLAGRDAQEELREQYAADAGVEYSIWKLLNDSTFQCLVDASPGSPVAVGSPPTVNQLATSITAEVVIAGCGAGGGGWAVMAPVPRTVAWGGSLVFDGGDYIYALTGKGSSGLYRYSISGNSWTQLANTPAGQSDGAALAYTGGDYLYAFRGKKQKTFWRYQISSDTWTSMADAPDAVKRGGALAWGGGDTIYGQRGGSGQCDPPCGNFWAYSISGDSWSFLASTPAQVDRGGALAYAGGDYLYSMRGDSSKDFWRYSISGNSWTPKASTPAIVFDGGALAYAGSDHLYALRGADSVTQLGTTDFWHYSISNDSWTPMCPTPAGVHVGGALAYAAGTGLFALRGGLSASAGSPDFWRSDCLVLDSEYEIVSQAGDFTFVVRVEIVSGSTTIKKWDIQ